MIYHERHNFPVNRMCALLGRSRSGYYRWMRRLQQPDRDAERLVQVQEIYQHSHQTYGYRRIALALVRTQRRPINHKAVLRLMRKAGLQSVARRRKPYLRPVVAMSVRTYPNRLARDFSAQAPNQKWVTDVTYVHTRQGWGYLSTIKDLYDGFIVAHVFGRHNSQSLVNRTLELAHQASPAARGVLLHSDRGFQYTSQAYALRLHAQQWQPSMSRRGNCWDNAPMENFFGHLKTEALHRVKHPSFEEATQLIHDYIHFYNYERIQLKTKQTPYERRLSL